MVHVGIDCRLWSQGGVGRYIRSLVANLNGSIQTTLFFMEGEKVDLPHNAKAVFTRATWHSFDEQTLFLSQVWRERLDLMHFTYFSHPVLYRRPFVLTVHDLTVQTMATGRATTRNPLVYGAKRLASEYVMLHGVRHAQTIFVPTLEVKRQLESYASTSKGKIIAAYEGVDTALKNAQAQALDVKDFILYVGNCYPHKRPELIREVTQYYPVVMIAPDDFFTRRFLSQLSDSERSRIHWYSHCSEGQLKWAYAHARMLFYPSVAEGFGLPVVEAAHFDCPLLLSDIPVFREIAPPGAVFFTDAPSKTLSLVPKRGKPYPVEWKSQFSWKRMAKKVLEVYASQ